MLQGGQGLLLHLQGCLVPFSLSQKLLRIHRSEIHSGGVENIGLQRMQTPPRLLYLQKRQQPCITMVSSSLWAHWEDLWASSGETHTCGKVSPLACSLVCMGRQEANATPQTQPAPPQGSQFATFSNSTALHGTSGPQVFDLGGDATEIFHQQLKEVTCEKVEHNCIYTYIKPFILN